MLLTPSTVQKSVTFPRQSSQAGSIASMTSLSTSERTVSTFLFLFWSHLTDPVSSSNCIVQLYLPDDTMFNKDFLKQVLAEEKMLMPISQVRFINVPHYDEVSVK